MKANTATKLASLVDYMSANAPSPEKTMKIELKKIHYSKALSQETAAYTAEIWVNGKKAGDVRNQGEGGMSMIYPRTLEADLAAYAKTLPATVYPASSGLPAMTLTPTADSVIDDLLHDHLDAKDLKRKMKTKVVFTVSDGKLYETRGLTRPTGTDVVKVLNDLPFDEALAIYRKVVA